VHVVINVLNVVNCISYAEVCKIKVSCTFLLTDRLSALLLCMEVAGK